MSSVGSSSVNMNRASASYRNQRSLNSRREGSTLQDPIASSTNDDGKIEDLVESRSSSHSSEPENQDKTGQGLSLSSNKPLATKSASDVIDKTITDSEVKIIEDTSASESYSSEDDVKKASKSSSGESQSSSSKSKDKQNVKEDSSSDSQSDE